MLLRNFINSIVPYSDPGSGIYLHTTGGTWSQIRPGCYGGNEGTEPYYFYHVGRTGSGTDYRGCIGIGIGKGATLPTLDDYLLEDPITSGLTSIGLSNNLYRNTEYLLSSGLTFSETLFNGGSADVEISEIGLFSCSSNSPQYGCDLLTRDVLTTPIVIKPGEAKTITVNLDLTQMSTNVNAS